MAPVIEVRGITKEYPGVLANDNISLSLEKGEILALLGENGAGKSTLMNIIYGLQMPDEGSILVNGQEVHFHDPSDAIDEGIGMVHQHFMLVPVMTVAENIMLGIEETANSAAISGGAAAVIGAVVALAVGGPVFAVVFALMAAGYVALALVGGVKLSVLQGALSGLGIGLILELISILLGTPYVAAWPLLGSIVGAVATLRWVDTSAVARRIMELSERYKLAVDPTATIRDLPVGAQQRVEIIKALYREARVLILDEPTAVLTPQEADELFGIMRGLADQGVSIIFITHKLHEVFKVADRIMVLRRGKAVGEARPEETTREKLAEMMVGREVVLQVDKGPAHPTEPVLEIHSLRVLDEREQVAVDDVSFTVRAGEIVGVAGVQGNGQTELVEAITGLRRAESGTVEIFGQGLELARPKVSSAAEPGPRFSIEALGKRLFLSPSRKVTDLGVGHIPEDRQRHGLVLPYPIADNLVLPDYYRRPFSRGIMLDEESIEENADLLVEQYDIRTPSIYTSASTLSGGNQQKVIVARELSRKPRLLIASQPTRGLDVGSIEFIHNQIVAARDSGAGVLLVSAELDEIMSLSDRVLVMYQGHVMDDLPIEEATRERIGLLMAGVKEQRTTA